MKKILTVLLGTSLLFVSACNSANETQEVEENTDAEVSYYENEDFGFKVQYPSELVLDGNGLWTKEDWDFKNSSSEPSCYACKPMVTIQSESLNGLSLEEFIVKDHSLGDVKTLDETGNFNKEDSSWTYENLNLGTSEFLRVEIPEYYHVIQYYTIKEDTVVSFVMYYEDDDNEVVKNIMASLEINSEEVTLKDKIEDFSNYILVTDPEEKSFVPSCDEYSESFAEKVKEGEVKKLSVYSSDSYGLGLYMTPNYDNWSEADFEKVNKCGELGSTTVKKILSGSLIWSYPNCSAGFKPNVDDERYEDFMACTEAEEELHDYLGY